MDFASLVGELPAARAEGDRESHVLQTHPTPMRSPPGPRPPLRISEDHRLDAVFRAYVQKETRR